MLKFTLIILAFLAILSNETLACTKYFNRKSYTCWYIMDLYGLNYQQLISLNPGLDCYNMRYDQPICVSGHANQPIFCNRKHYTRPRDTCYTIVRYYGVSMTRLQRCNPMLNCASHLPIRQLILF
jgi:hypothetical protein